MPFSADEFFEVFADYNRSLWLGALGLWLYAAAAVLILARRGSAGRFMAAMLAVQWVWAGVVYHAGFFTSINPAAWMFAALFVVESALLVWFGVVRGQLEFSPTVTPLGIASWGLIVYALLYPAIVQADGHTYPAAPTFGVPCPTTLLTIGVLLSARRPWPRVVALIPMAWAVVAGSAALLLGVRADLMLWVSAAALTASLLLPRARLHSRVKEVS